jgi:hypothetical protein
MRTLILFIFLTVTIAQIKAQSTISVAADYGQTSSMTLSWTIGEAVVGAISNSNHIATQGFHQSKLVITSIENEPVSEASTCEGDAAITLSVTGGGYGPIRYQWYGPFGEITGATDATIIIEALPNNSGTYYCIVGSDLGRDVQSIDAFVNIYPNYNVSETDDVCYNDSYYFPDGTVQDNIISTVEHTSYLSSVYGCDSIVKTTVYTSPVRCNIFNKEEVVDTNLSSGDIECFNALNTIVVAGNGTNVVIDNGANAEFIAGEKIRFLPGFSANAGSYVSAVITSNGSFCEPPVSSIVENYEPDNEKGAPDITTDEENSENFELANLKVYPNPNNGSFNVVLENVSFPSLLLIYNAIGEKVFQSAVDTNSKTINLASKKSGIYFVMVVDNDNQLTKKIIIN